MNTLLKLTNDKQHNGMRAHLLNIQHRCAEKLRHTMVILIYKKNSDYQQKKNKQIQERKRMVIV